MNNTRRRYTTTPEERAAVVNDRSNSLSGNSYIAVIMRDNGRYGRVPFYRDPEKCDHGFAMCPTWECVESWTMDYRVLLHRTGAGRVLAEVLDVDPVKVSRIEHHDLTILKVDDYRYDSASV